MAEKPKVPAAIETYFKKKDAGDAYLQAHDDEIINAHREGVKAIVKARQAVVGPDKKITHADIEISHLHNSDVENLYVNAVKKHLLTKAKEKYGIKPDDKLAAPGAESGLLEMYSGFNDQSLREFYKLFVHGGEDKKGRKYEALQQKAHFSSSRFASMYQQSDAASRLKERIEVDSVAHLHGTEHIKDILKYTGADKHMNDTSLIRSGLELRTMLDFHKQKGEALTDSEVYVILKQMNHPAHLDAKYHPTFLKEQKKDVVTQGNFSKMYTEKKAA